jgi:membrane associated rhomboid family serine protease
MIPVAAGDPPAGGKSLSKSGDAGSELLGCGGGAQIDARELKSAPEKVNVRVVESGKEKTASGIDDARAFGRGAADAGAGADGFDSPSPNQDGLGDGAAPVHGPDTGVDYGEVLYILRKAKGVSGANPRKAPRETEQRADHSDIVGPEATSSAMGFPVRDRGFGGPSPFTLTTGVKWLLIVNTGLFLVSFLAWDSPIGSWLGRLGLTPREFLFQFALWQPFTYMFLHSPFGFGHILVNMLSLWMFGSTLEQTWGTRRFLRYYFYCGLGAAVCVVLLNAVFGSLDTRTIGASGAIYGLLLAFGVLFPEAVILFMFIFPMKAKHFVMLMAAIVFLSTIRDTGGAVSHIAHLGGMLTGWIILKANLLDSRRQAARMPNPIADLSRQYKEWRFRRAKKKFQVYLQNKDRDRGPWIH